jgi:hypothetical protein
MSTTRDRKSTEARAAGEEPASTRAKPVSEHAADATPAGDGIAVTPTANNSSTMDEIRQETREWL